VVQKCNWSAELFTTNVVFHKPNGTSDRLYYDHQDGYWGRGRAEIDQEKHLISIVRGGRVVATFDYLTDTYTLTRRDFPQRTESRR
jgi:hypothetical protein